MPQAAKVLGYRRSFGTHFKPIFDLDELKEACRNHTPLIVENEVVYPLGIYAEDGSGMSWILKCYGRSERWLYALCRGKMSKD